MEECNSEYLVIKSSKMDYIHNTSGEKQTAHHEAKETESRSWRDIDVDVGFTENDNRDNESDNKRQGDRHVNADNSKERLPGV